MNIDINRITKTILRKQRGLEDPQLIHPARDWSLGIVVTLIVMFGATIFSVFEYRAYTNLSLDDVAVETMVPYRAVFVANAISKYEARRVAHEAVLAEADSAVATPDSTATSSLGEISSETLPTSPEVSIDDAPDQINFSDEDQMEVGIPELAI